MIYLNPLNLDLLALVIFSMGREIVIASRIIIITHLFYVCVCVHISCLSSLLTHVVLVAVCSLYEPV